MSKALTTGEDMALKLSQFASFVSGNTDLDRVQKAVSLAVDPIVKALLSWKLALSTSGWLQYDDSDLVDVDSVQTLAHKTLDTSNTISASSWAVLALNSPWSEFGSTYRSLSYRKDQMGVLYLSGLIAASADPGAFDIIGTLPAGFCPAFDTISPLVRASWGGTNRNVAIQVHTDGRVELNEPAPGVAVTFLAVEVSFPLA
jgi:hypothetical protein